MPWLLCMDRDLHIKSGNALIKQHVFRVDFDSLSIAIDVKHKSIPFIAHSDESSVFATGAELRVRSLRRTYIYLGRATENTKLRIVLWRASAKLKGR